MAARVLALIPDLLFGSRVKASLAAASCDVELLASDSQLREHLARTPPSSPTVLIVDLTDPDLDGPAIVRGLREAQAQAQGPARRDGEGDARLRVLGFYSHVDAQARRRAEDAGFDVVVPRSRMARESAELVLALAQRG